MSRATAPSPGPLPQCVHLHVHCDKFQGLCAYSCALYIYIFAMIQKAAEFHNLKYNSQIKSDVTKLNPESELSIV